MKLFETRMGKQGIPHDFETFEDEEFAIRRQTGNLLELAGVRGAKQFQVTYRDFIFQITKVEDAEGKGIGPVELCRLYYEGVKKAAEVKGEPALGTCHAGNRMWFEMDFVSKAKGKTLGNAIFATNLLTAQGNKLVAVMLNWDMDAFVVGKEYVDEVLGSFSPHIRKKDLQDGEAAIIGAVSVEQPPKSSSIGRVLLDAANAGEKKIELRFSIALLLDGASVFTAKDLEGEPAGPLAPGEVRAVQLKIGSPEFPDGDYELVLSAGLKGGKSLVESRIPISFRKPS